MTNFLAPLYRATDASGNAISGAVLYFYATGTTNALATYPTYALAATGGAGANTNPVVADANGWFGRIFLRPDYQYTVVLKTAVGGTTIWTADAVDSSFLNDSSLATRIEQIASNPMDNGATGDGVANDYAAVQAAIDNATGVVDLLGKTYKVNSALDLKAGVTVRNGALDFTSCADTYYVTSYGQSTAYSTLLTANAVAGATTISVASVSGFVAGGTIFLEAPDATYGAAAGRDGELCTIISIAGLDVTLAAPLNGTYNTADTGYVSVLNMESGVSLEHVTITGSKTATAATMFRGLYAERLTFTGCTFSGIKTAGLQIRQCANVSIDNCKFTDGSATANGIDINSGGININVSACSFSALQHGIYLGADAVDIAGVDRNVVVEGSTFESCSTAGIKAGILSHHLYVGGCIFRVTNPADGIHLTSIIDVRIGGCTFVGGDYGIDDTTVTGLIASSNYFTGQTTGAIRGTASAALVVAGSTGNQAGVQATGYGSGRGIHGIGGTTDGTGVYGKGGATNGPGVVGVGTGSGSGVAGTGGTTGAGLSGTGGNTSGVGVKAQAGSAASAALYIVPQDNCTTPNAGDVIVQGTTAGIRHYTGAVWGSVPSMRYAAVADGTTVANSTDETETLAFTIPAGSLLVGTRIRIKGVIYGIANVGGGLLDCYVRLQGISAGEFSETLTPAKGYIVEGDIVITAVGVAGSFRYEATCRSHVTGDVAARYEEISGSLNTTAAMAVSLRGKMSVANANNSFKGTMLFVEIYG
jgi:hypothetical protein